LKGVFLYACGGLRSGQVVGGGSEGGAYGANSLTRNFSGYAAGLNIGKPTSKCVF
jgi:hypothetical protein